MMLFCLGCIPENKQQRQKKTLQLFTCICSSSHKGSSLAQVSNGLVLFFAGIVIYKVKYPSRVLEKKRGSCCNGLGNWSPDCKWSVKVRQFTSLSHPLGKGAHEVFRHPCKVSCETPETASSPAGSVEEGGCGCRLPWVEVVPQKAPSGASGLENQQLITCWGFSERWCHQGAWLLSVIPFSWEKHIFIVTLGLGKQFLKWLFRAKTRETSLHAPGLARWGVIAGMSEDCETESRTAVLRTSCTLALKCCPCFLVRSVFSFFHWISLTVAACLPLCRACGNEPWRGFSGIKEVIVEVTNITPIW